MIEKQIFLYIFTIFILTNLIYADDDNILDVSDLPPELPPGLEPGDYFQPPDPNDKELIQFALNNKIYIELSDGSIIPPGSTYNGPKDFVCPVSSPCRKTACFSSTTGNRIDNTNIEEGDSCKIGFEGFAGIVGGKVIPVGESEYWESAQDLYDKLTDPMTQTEGSDQVDVDSGTYQGDVDSVIYENGIYVGHSDNAQFSNGGSASGINNGVILDDGSYYFEEVDSLIDHDIAIINGKDVYKYDNTFGAGSADTLKKGNSLSSDVKEFLFFEENKTITIEEANAVSIDNSMLNHIKNSTFTLDNNKLTDADIMSGKDNNSFMLKDGINVLADNGEMFNAKFSDDGTIIKTNDSMTISNGFETIITESNPLPDVDYNQSNITLKNIGGNILEIDKELGVVSWVF